MKDNRDNWATFVPPSPCPRGHSLRYVATAACVECYQSNYMHSDKPRKARCIVPLYLAGISNDDPRLPALRGRIKQYAKQLVQALDDGGAEVSAPLPIATPATLARTVPGLPPLPAEPGNTAPRGEELPRYSDARAAFEAALILAGLSDSADTSEI